MGVYLVPERAFDQDRFRSTLVWAVLLLLLINTVLVGGVFYLIRTSFPTAAERYSSKQEVARDMAAYSYRLAEELGVLERAAVKEALAAFNYEIEISKDDELTKLILEQGRKLQEIILREADLLFMDQILEAVNLDEQIRRSSEEAFFSLHLSTDEVYTVPGNALSLDTISKIEGLIPRDRFTADRVLEIEVKNGIARLGVPYNPEEKLQALTEELDATRLKLHELRVEAGLAEMIGEGITVKLYDKMGATSSSSIIHDTDIRDVVNELFASGAKGISLGGQRLIVTSSVRCSGSLIKVNDKLITVNPVVIQAVGDPDLLISGLDIIKNSMEASRGIRFEIIREELVKLPAYTQSAE